MILANIVRRKAGAYENIWDDDKVTLHSNLAYVADYFGIGLIAIETEYEIEKICNLCDGLLIPGSPNNIDPRYYGGNPFDSPCKFDEYALDSKVISAFDKMKKPMFGICGGLQAINVFYGGTLDTVLNLRSETYREQDLAHGEKRPHNDRYGNEIIYSTHMINVEKDSFVYDVFGTERTTINTYHNLAIKRLANGFRVAATSDDNIIEAIEWKEKKIYATQWHPELAFRMGDPVEMKFFENFIRICEENSLL